MKPFSIHCQLLATFFIFFLFTATAKSQSSGFGQFMGINLRVDEPSLGKAQCVSHAREFHDWIRDQGKWVQDDNSEAVVDYLVKPDIDLLSGQTYNLYDLSDEDLINAVGTLNTNTAEYAIGSNTFHAYWYNTYDEVWVGNNHLRSHLRVFYYLGENCFLSGDEDDPLNGADCADPVCDCTSGSPGFPNQQFKWNPPYQSQAEVHYDFFYDQVNGLGLSMSSAMNGTLPRYALGEADPENGQVTFLERIPIQWAGSNFNPEEGESSTDPYSYRERADWIFQFLLKYGSGGPSNAMTKFHPNETTEVNRGNVSYLESWNEPNKNWHENDPQTEFSPEQYAAMASCDYDGHINTVNINDAGVTHNYGLGVKQFGTSFVMGAPFDLNWDWVEDMNTWFESNRDDGDPSTDEKIFVFDILNFHHYSALDISNGEWMCPEDDMLKSKLKGMVSQRDANGYSAGKPLWLSEFGYSTGTAGGAQFPAIGLDDNEVQAQWIARSFLEIAASGFDRAYIYELSDATPPNTGSWDQQTGLLTADGQPKRSWFYVYSLKNILGSRKYSGELFNSGMCTGEEFDSDGTSNNTPCPRIYKFSNGNPCETIYAIWNPSAAGSAYTGYNYSLPLTCGNVATGIKLVDGSINGLETQLSVVNGQAIVPVSETPIFVVERPANVPTCLGITVEETTCNSVTLALDAGGQDFDSYQIWYGLQGSIPDPDNPGFSPFDGNLTQFQHDVPGNIPSATVSGLDPGMSYYVYVLPQGANGIPADASGGPIYCHVSVQTTMGTGGGCALPITIVSDSNVPPNGTANTEGELFDDQGNSCALLDLSANTSYPFVDLQSSGRNTVVELGGKNMLIDNIELFDGTDASVFTVEGSLDNMAGSYELLTQYFTNSLNKWVNISNFDQSIDGYRYLKFTNPDNLARIKEAVICGRESCLLNDNAASLSYCIDYDPQLIGSALGCNRLIFQATNSPQNLPYNTIEIWYSTSGPFLSGEHPKVTDPSAQSLVTTIVAHNPFFPWYATVEISGLSQATQYWFAYRMLDNEGRSTRLYVMDRSFWTSKCPCTKNFGPVIDGNCKVDGIGWEVDDTQNGGYFQVVETDGEVSAPLNNPNKTTTVQVSAAQEDYFYFIDKNDPASATTSWLYLNRVFPNDATTCWDKVDMNSSKLCSDVTTGRSANFSEGEGSSYEGDSYLYPNPAGNEINLVLQPKAHKYFTIIDITGKKVSSRYIAPGKSSYSIDISDLPSGFYYLRLGGGVGFETLKFIIK
ncbi:MAG TPA: T9SS type A sorting domain-containing protein [Bacteroidetes bacterium]|nr:T9SS type A sorting domain-containing protein [Bacteroidota bacterium]